MTSNHDIPIFTYEDAGDAIILKNNLVKAWRRRIATMQPNRRIRYQIVETPTGAQAIYNWRGSDGQRMSATKHATLQVAARFNTLRDAIYFKLKYSDDLRGTLTENARRLNILYETTEV